MLEQFNLLVQIYMTVNHAPQRDAATVMGINPVTLSRVLTGVQKMHDERMEELQKKLVLALDAEKVRRQLSQIVNFIRNVQDECFAESTSAVIKNVYNSDEYQISTNMPCNTKYFDIVLTVFNQLDGYRKLFRLCDTSYNDFKRQLVSDRSIRYDWGPFDFYKQSTTLAVDDSAILVFSDKGEYTSACELTRMKIDMLQKYNHHCTLAYIDLEAGTLEETELK